METRTSCQEVKWKIYELAPRCTRTAWEAQAPYEQPHPASGWCAGEAARWLANEPGAEELRDRVRYYAAVADGWAEKARLWLDVATRDGMDLAPFEHEDETIARLREEIRVLGAGSGGPRRSGRA